MYSLFTSLSAEHNWGVVLLAAAICFIGSLTAIIFLYGARAARGQSYDDDIRLDVALNNMRQGLLMFDADGQLVLFNQRFVQIYNLPLEKMKVGCTLRDILRLRKEAGTFKGDPDQYVVK